MTNTPKEKKAKKKVETPETKTTSPVAKLADGTIQITLTLPWNQIKDTMDAVAEKMGQTMTVPGFRKGMAPIDKVINNIPKETLTERTLHQLLPKLFQDIVEEQKIRPIMYPKFELLHAHEQEDWEIRATTCELPEFELGDYKKVATEAIAAGKIWTPEDGEKKEISLEEKQDQALKALLETIKITIPAILIEEEANNRLSSLLERIETLGLSLENYLASVKKTAPELRNDYEKEAESNLKLEFILAKIAEAEKLTVEDSELDSFIQAASASTEMKEKLQTEEQKRFIYSLLLKRKALESLVPAVIS